MQGLEQETVSAERDQYLRLLHIGEVIAPTKQRDGGLSYVGGR